jgi:hypothetical protein
VHAEAFRHFRLGRPIGEGIFAHSSDHIGHIGAMSRTLRPVQIARALSHWKRNQPRNSILSNAFLRYF